MTVARLVGGDGPRLAGCFNGLGELAFTTWAKTWVGLTIGVLARAWRVFAWSLLRARMSNDADGFGIIDVFVKSWRSHFSTEPTSGDKATPRRGPPQTSGMTAVGKVGTVCYPMMAIIARMNARPNIISDTWPE